MVVCEDHGDRLVRRPEHARYPIYSAGVFFGSMLRTRACAYVSVCVRVGV